MRNRVLHVIPSVSLAHGGPSIAIREIERSLGSSKWWSETVTTNDDGPGNKILSPLARCISHDGSSRRYFNKNTELYKVAWSFVPWIRRHATDYDLIHIHSLFSFLSVVAAVAARRSGVPYIVRPLGVLNRYGITHHRPWLKRLSLRLIERPILKNAAAVHFTSEAEREEALELGLSFNAVIIPLGIGQKSVRDDNRKMRYVDHPNETVRLLYLSRLDPKKNLEGLIDALSVLRHQGAQVSLTIAGSGSPTYVRSLVDRVRSNGLERDVRWLGQVSGEKKLDVLANSDIFVLPSFSENFGVSVVEAMAAGLPCVVGRGVALANAVVQAGAGLSVDTDAHSIAAGIKFYLASYELRATTGYAARDLAYCEFSTEIMGERLVQLYDSLI